MYWALMQIGTPSVSAMLAITKYGVCVCVNHTHVWSYYIICCEVPITIKIVILSAK